VTGEAAVAISDRGAQVLPDRLGALFDSHHRRLYQLARRLSRTPEDARDLVQETFLRAARTPRSIPDGAQDEEAWLVRVLVNLCRDQWRRRAAERRRGVHAEAMHVALPVDPESAAIAHSVVWRALEALAPRRRAVLVMHELEGAGIDAVARTLGISAVTVRWHLSRGRRQLEQAIRHQGTRS
jgi:RNA polymerase sigma-70 factor, ECF subfamily